MVAAVLDHEAEHTSTFIENGLTLYVDGEGMVRLGFRLDPAKNLATLDAVVEPPPKPAGGWPKGTVMVNERPVVPIQTAVSATRPSTTVAASGPRPVVTRVARRGPSRERRSRSTRRTRAASRGDPSDTSEGDGEPSPAPAPAEPERPAERPAPSNRQQGEGFFGAWSVADHGIDTISYAFRPKDQAALDAFAALPACRLTRRERGDSRWAQRSIDGGKLGMFPRHGLLVFEGRLAPLLSGDPDDTRLASPQALPEGAERARQAFASLGVVMSKEPLVRRLDLAAEPRFESPPDGLLLLRAFGGLQLATRDQDRKASKRQTRSVLWELARGVDLRLYDAGVQHGTDPPGARLRLERQMRWRKADQLPPEAFTERSLAALYLGPLNKLIHTAPTMRVLPSRAAERHIMDLAKTSLSLAVAERMIGLVRVVELCQDAALWDAETAARRYRELLTRTGLSLDDCADGAASGLDVRAILLALADRWTVTDDRDRTTVPTPTESATAVTRMPVGPIRGAT